MTPKATEDAATMVEAGVGERLDNLLLEILDGYDQLQMYYKGLAKHTNSGHMNIAQARHFKGPMTVGELQYPANMSPTLKVEITPQPVASVPGGLEYNVFSSYNPEERKQDNEEASSSSNNDKGEGLRQRGAGEGAEEKKSEGDEKATQDKAEPARKKSVNNPLRWFGVLVPMPLRNAQADFKNATAMCLEMSTLRSKLLVLMDEYTRLLAEKQKGGGASTASAPAKAKQDE